MPRRPRVLHLLGWSAAAAVILWLAGFGWFIVSSVSLPGDSETAATDAIVVLTGGRLRLETGLALLAAGKAKQLFISGVNPRVDRDALLRALGPAAEREACCIVLGRQADDTFGNALETEVWMRQQGYASLRLVTSWYHMRRALLEFRRAMPQVTMISHPVFAPRPDQEEWWGRHGAVALVVVEFNKYLGAWLRPTLERVLPSALTRPAPPPSLPVIRTMAAGPRAADMAEGVR